MSPRAASRLESMGFQRVYDYVAGKADWMGSGLEIEGTSARRPRAGDVSDANVPTCWLEERVGGVRDRVKQSGWSTCIVVNDQGIVLGRLRSKALDSDSNTRVEDVMESGPSTIRPDVELVPMLERMREQGIDEALVTTLDGRLVGVLRRKDVERALAASRERAARG